MVLKGGMLSYLPVQGNISKVFNSFYLKPFFYKNDIPKEDFIVVDYSDKDKNYNDSIIQVVKSGELNFYFPDEIKDWRKMNLIYLQRNINAKYKFHGSDALLLAKDDRSLKIKSKEYIKGTKQFNLISCAGVLPHAESSFFNVFLAAESQQLDIISPDPGRIVIANVNKKLKDYWMTSDLSPDYLDKKYNLKKYNIFNINDNWLRFSEKHNSILDGYYYYYLDGENYLETEDSYGKGYSDYKEFIIKTNNNDLSLLNKIDKKYMGRFLAYLYYFYMPHYILGDNNKLLFNSNDELFYPISRNEGKFVKIPNLSNFDKGVFDYFGEIEDYNCNRNVFFGF